MQLATWKVAPGLYGASMDYLSMADGWVTARALSPKFGISPASLSPEEWSRVYHDAQLALQAGHVSTGNYVHGDMRLNNIMVRLSSTQAADVTARSRQPDIMVPTARLGPEGQSNKVPLASLMSPAGSSISLTNRSAADRPDKGSCSADPSPSAHSASSLQPSLQQLSVGPATELPTASTYGIMFIDFDWAGPHSVARCAAQSSAPQC